jgi:hypothetical protein
MSDLKYKYYYFTGRPITKRDWDGLLKKYAQTDNKILDGKMTVAYRVVREMTEAERVKAEGRF